MMNGYNFTNRVREVLAGAREEAAALRHEYVGTEHVLLALLRADDSVAVHVLENLGVDRGGVRDMILGVIKRGTAERAGPNLPYTSRAKKALELAMTQARTLHTNYVGTEHLLLGLIAEKKGIAAQVLADRGVTLDDAVAEAVRVLGTVEEGADDASMPPEVERYVRHRPAAPSTSERFRSVTSAAYEIAKQHGGDIVAPAHIALALLDHGDGIANVVFTRLGLDAARVRAELEKLASAVGESSPVGAHRLDRASLVGVMERDSSATPGGQLSTAHLALALLDEASSVAPAFAACGVTRAKFSEELARISG